MVIEQPAWGQVRVSVMLKRHGLSISPARVRCVWQRHDLTSMKHRLKDQPPSHTSLLENAGGLCAGPVHDRHTADAIFRTAFDDAVAIGHIDQYVALAVEEADHL